MWRSIVKHKLIVGPAIGVSAGVAMGLFLKTYTVQPWSKRDIMYLKYPGDLLIRFVNSLILPMVISSIVSATYNVRKSGSIGILALYYYITTTALGIILSVILVQTIRPGEILRSGNTVSSTSTQHHMTVDTFLDLLRNMIPDNIVNACLQQYVTVLEKPENDSVPIYDWKISHKEVPGTNILGLVFFSLLLGVALGSIQSEAEPLLNFFQSLSEVVMRVLNWVIMIIPVGVLFLICGKILEVEEFTTIFKRLGIYILTVFAGLLIQGFILLPLVYFIATRKSPYKLISKLGPALATACGTSSSTATVPVTIRCLEQIGIDPKLTRFIVPIGATINMDGIALYETIGAIFIIQLRGLEFPLIKIIIISITCTISCIGAAGLPNGGYMMLIMVLNSVGVPAEDVSLIIAIDWFVDRFRTTINIIADALGAGIISHCSKKNATQSETIEEAKPLNSKGT